MDKASAQIEELKKNSAGESNDAEKENQVMMVEKRIKSCHTCLLLLASRHCDSPETGPFSLAGFYKNFSDIQHSLEKYKVARDVVKKWDSGCYRVGNQSDDSLASFPEGSTRHQCQRGHQQR